MRESYLSLPGAQLYVREIGSGTPLVILHGGPDFNHAYLLPEMDRLASAFRLIFYDQRGRGRSSSGVVPEDVTIESEVDDLEKLRRHFSFPAISLLGHSWGALLALEYATRYPDRTSGLVLMNAAPVSHADLLFLRERRQEVEAESLAKMRVIASTREFADGDIDVEAEYYRIHFNAALSRPELVEAVVSRLRTDFSPADILKARAIEDRLYTETLLSPEYSLLPRLRQSRTPALVLHGDRDFIPLACASHIAEAMPAARLVTINNCGHFSYLERPTEVFLAVVERLSQG